MLKLMRKCCFSSKKDYYKILGIDKSATIEEIKEAYITKAKIYHPDVRSDNVQNFEADKFKDIAEAYAVLSIPESKLSFDLLNQQNPDLMKMSKRDQFIYNMNNRGVNGQRIKEQKFNDLEREKREIMKQERLKYNVDEFGRYKGGIPQKAKGTFRGNALGAPGSYHDPLYHNFSNDPNPKEQNVTVEDAMAFKHYQKEDKMAISKRKIWFPAVVDYEFFNFKPTKILFRWLRNIFIIFMGIGTAFEIHCRRQNREIVKQLKQLAKSKEKFTFVNNHRIVVSPNGVYSKA